jgi:hypothetical protein
MKKLATLLLVMISLVITPVVAGQCYHAHAASVSGDVAAQLDTNQDDDSGKQSPSNPAHLAHHHCCGHAPALHNSPSSDLALNASPHKSVIGNWKEARYNSRDVSPLLEPPSHA